MPLIGLSVALTSPGPVFYRQERVGRGGALFSIIKYRTMVEDAEASTGPVLSDSTDRRTTRVGRVLRRYHFDELPQVVNVLAGQMSFVGPRPERPHFHAQFVREVPAWAGRLAVLPGVTGLAQVRGHDAFSPEAKLKSDTEYALTASVRLDILIVFKTLIGGAGGKV